jgi:O-antigen/teichoic acid export membrane protein
MYKKVFYNTTAQVIGKIITASATLLITLLIGKSLGPSGYGDFTKIFVFVAYFYTFADFGFNTIYIKLAQGNKRELINYLLGLRLLLSLLLLVLAISISQLLPYNPTSGIGFSPLVKLGIIIASLTIVTQALFTSLNAFFQKNLRYDLSTISAIAGTVVILTVTAIASFTKAPLSVYVSAYVFGGFTLVASSTLIIAGYFKEKISISFSRQVFIDLLKTTWPIGAALIFNLIYFRVDVLILSYTRPSAEVGLYGLAYQFFEAALSIPIFFANALYPLLAKLYLENQKEYVGQVKKWSIILILISLLLTVCLMIASILIPLLFDTRFNGSQAALIILATGMPFFFLSAFLWHLLIIRNQQKLLILVYFFGGIFNLAVNLKLIPTYGILAASATTVLSEALIALMLVLIIKFAKAPDTQKELVN